MSNSVGQNQTLQCPICLARVTQLQGESVEKYIARFRKLRTRCQTSLTEKECVNLALRGLNFNMREKFEGKELTDLFHLATRAASYERLLKEKKKRRTSSKGTYYKDPSLEIAVVEYDSTSESEDEEVCVAELVQALCPALMNLLSGLISTLMNLAPLFQKAEAKENELYGMTLSMGPNATLYAT